MITEAGKKWNYRDQLEVPMRFPNGQEIIVASFELKFRQWKWGGNWIYSGCILIVDMIGLHK